MLEVADNLNAYISGKGVELSEDLAEELSILLSKNKDSVLKIFKGAEADEMLAQEKAEIVDIKQA
jgi:dsDNA-binding SOS-regulon protein